MPFVARSPFFFGTRCFFSASKNTSEPPLVQKTVYKRQLPGFLIQLNSEFGKKVFSEAFQEGNMECFFPLIEQFTTQYKPSTCGTTTLTMCLNALGIDPKTTWKGIWRWYSEESLACSHPDYLNEIDIEKFTHLAKRNYCSIQMFYHKALANSEGFEKFTLECPSGQHSSTSIFKKSASFETFFDCCMASARRDGFFLVTNTSRRALGQTGIGHFSPIGGVNLSRNLALILDVARYKYPPYFCGISKLYESLEETDTATKRPRGFCLLTRSHQTYARICRETEDFLSITNVKKNLQGFRYDTNNKKGLSLVKDVFLGLLKALGQDFRFLLVHYLFELGTRIDPDQTPHHETPENLTFDNVFGEKYLKLLREEIVDLEMAEFSKEICLQMKEDRELKRIVGLIEDFHPYLVEEIVGIMIFAMPWGENVVKGIFKGNEELIKKLRRIEEKKEVKRMVRYEVENLRLNLGFDSVFQEEENEDE